MVVDAIDDAVDDDAAAAAAAEEEEEEDDDDDDDDDDVDALDDIYVNDSLNFGLQRLSQHLMRNHFSN